jgi:hypothetical protein
VIVESPSAFEAMPEKEFNIWDEIDGVVVVITVPAVNIDA